MTWRGLILIWWKRSEGMTFKKMWKCQKETDKEMGNIPQNKIYVRSVKCKSKYDWKKNVRTHVLGPEFTPPPDIRIVRTHVLGPVKRNHTSFNSIKTTQGDDFIYFSYPPRQRVRALIYLKIQTIINYFYNCYFNFDAYFIK